MMEEAVQSQVQRSWRRYPKPPAQQASQQGQSGQGQGSSGASKGAPSPGAPKPGQGKPGQPGPGAGQGRPYQLQSSGAPGPAPNGVPKFRQSGGPPSPPTTPPPVAPPTPAQMPSAAEGKKTEQMLRDLAQSLKESLAKGDQPAPSQVQVPRELQGGIMEGMQGAESGKATNKIQVFTPAMRKKLQVRRLQAEFARIVGTLAEDLTGPPIDGDDEWDVSALLERQITHRSVQSCRQSRIREALVLILDNSGSCAEMAEFYSQLAEVAAKTGDVEIFLGPNAQLERHYHPKRGWENLGGGHVIPGYAQLQRRWYDAPGGSDLERKIGEQMAALVERHHKLAGRTILFFGDFDGTDQICAWSRNSKFYWFNCNDPSYGSQSKLDRWTEQNRKQFRGKHWYCVNEADLFRLAKRVRP